MTRLMLACFVASVFAFVGCDKLTESLPSAPSALAEGARDSKNPVAQAGEVIGEVIRTTAAGIPQRINGVELLSIRGWHANIYPWDYDPNSSGVHPVSRLWTPNQKPSSFQMAEQCQQIKEFGGGAVVLEYSPTPALRSWHDYWQSLGFARDCGPFYLLYEEINGTAMIPADGAKNMSIEHNRQVFKTDIDFMFRNVILPNQSRYVTVDGRAVIYMWATQALTGDFGSLLEEVKAVYPVFFIGDEGPGDGPGEKESLERAKALDGFMNYNVPVGSDYMEAVQGYRRGTFKWRQFIRRLESETGKKYVYIPTFQAAYDDSKVPGRGNPQMYARTREEVEYHAELIRAGMGTIYDSVGPFVIYSELPEGASVIESQCRPDNVDRPGRFYGCGTARLQILKKFFKY